MPRDLRDPLIKLTEKWKKEKLRNQHLRDNKNGKDKSSKPKVDYKII